MKTQLLVLAALFAETQAIRFVNNDDEFYQDNQEVMFWANKEINHANRPGAPRNDFETSWEKSQNDLQKTIAPPKPVSDLHIEGYADSEMVETRQGPQVIQYVPNEGYLQTGAELGVRFMPQELLEEETRRPTESSHVQYEDAITAIRPGDLVGWSDTRSIYEDLDYNNEFGQNKHVFSNENHNLMDDVRRQPGDKQTPNMEALTTSWMQGSDTAAIADRLQSLDEEGWALSAHQATKGTMREMLTDLIDDETDRLNTQKRDEAAFHADYIVSKSDSKFSSEQIDEMVKTKSATRVGDNAYMIHVAAK